MTWSKRGLVKFDFLGLRTLTIIDNALKSINTKRQHQGQQPLDIDVLNLEDTAIYDNLKAGENHRGISAGITEA